LGEKARQCAVPVTLFSVDLAYSQAQNRTSDAEETTTSDEAVDSADPPHSHVKDPSISDFPSVP